MSCETSKSLLLRKMFLLFKTEFEVKFLSKGKSKDIEGYEIEILKIGGPILIPHIHKLFNLEIKQSLISHGLKASLFLFLK